jgi:chromosome segregation ATPase
MAPTSAGTRVVAILAFVVVVFFVTDLVLLQRVAKRERELASSTGPATVEEPKNPSGTTGPGDTPGGNAESEAVEAAGLRAKIADLEEEAKQLRATVTERFADREAIRTEAASVHVQLDDARAALEGTKTELAATAQRESELRNERQQIADLVAKLNAELKATNAKGEQLKADLKTAQDSTAAEKARADGLQKSLDEANTTLEAAKKLLDEKAKESEALQARVAELQARVAELEGQTGSGANPGEGQGQ